MILAAGRGSRMAPLSDSVPKGLIPLAGKTILNRLVDVLTECGVESIRIGIGWKAELYEEHIESLQRTHDLETVQVSSIEKGPLHTLVSTMDSSDNEPFLISPVDYVTEPKIVRQIIDAHTEGGDSRLATIAIDPTAKNGSPVFIRSDGGVSGLGSPLTEHNTKHPTAMLTAVSPAAKDFFREAHSSGKKTVMEAINAMVLNERQVFSTMVEGHWSDVDSISTLLEASDLILSRSTETFKESILVPSNDIIEIGNAIELPSGILLASGVRIKGPAFIGPECRIEENCSIGPGVSMGSKTQMSCDSSVSRSVLFGSACVREGQHINDSVIYNDNIFKEAA